MLKHSFNKRQLAVAVAAVLASTTSGIASAADMSFAIEEVMVTAQKRSESAQDVPVAISAFSEDMVRNTGVDTITDIIPMIPGLTGSSYGNSTNAWAIRGISTNDWSAGSEPSVGVFIDDAYIGRSVLAMSAFFDIDRIEVVKGPQGTLFGRNASVGAISIITNKPTDEDSLQLGLAAGNEGQQEYDVVGNLAASDQLTFRFAYHGSRLEGIIDDVVQNEEGFTDRDDFRLMTRWAPSEDFEALLTLNYSDADTNLNGAYNPGLSAVEPGEEFPDNIGHSVKERENTESDGVNLRLTWDLTDNMTLTSITDRRSFESSYVQDVDGTSDDAFIDAAFEVGTGGATISFATPETEQDSISQEFRLNGTAVNIDWFVGASYFEEDIDETTIIDLVDTALGLGLLAEDRIVSGGTTESYGVYGDVKWALNDELSITGGLRWSQDKKDWCTASSAEVGLAAIDTLGKVCGDETWSETTPRLVVDYSFSNDVMAFASVSKGYKGGGFNAVAGDFVGGDLIGDGVAAFDPETNLAYELGLKSTLMDGRLQFNASTYLNDYEDLQIQTATLAGILTTNAAEAETKGVELEATYMPIADLKLMANYSYLDAEFTKGDLDGAELAYAPENSYSISASYEQSLTAGSLNWFAMYNWQDDFYYDVDNVLAEDSYGLLNAKLTFTPSSEAWDLALAVDNISDEDYAVFRQDIGLGEALTRGMPRLWKVEFNAYF